MLKPSDLQIQRATETFSKICGEPIKDIKWHRTFNDGEWNYTIIFNSELAALRYAWVYREMKGCTMGYSTNLGGWFVSLDRSI